VLRANEVHVWRAALEQPASRVQRLVRTLSGDETARAGRFRFERDREHFIVARAVLRALLGRYLGIGPASVVLCYGRHGKPALADECAADGLRFNVSHSDGLGLFAFTRGREVGIDLEHIRRDMVGWEIAERFFSRLEIAMLRRIPADRQTEAFFSCWTRKEAYVKARGEGLSFPLDQFDVSVAPGQPAALLGVRGDSHEVSKWSLQDLSPGLGYGAALAVEGRAWRLERWQWAEGVTASLGAREPVGRPALTPW
jgi:4'-phosphopantetheinyl transferase